MLHIKGWVGEKGMGSVEGRGGGLTMLSDTGDQDMCTMGQTDGHSSPDHTMRRADIEWNSLAHRLPY